jgi:hypothetical protein
MDQRRAALLLVLAGLLAALVGCGPKNEPILPPPKHAASSETFDPSSGCQRALDHVIDLSAKATGAGPTLKQRSEFLSACAEARSLRASDCVLALRRLPGRRGGKVGMGPAMRCLKRR